MIRMLALAGLLSSAAFAAPAPDASAETMCGNRNDIVAKLSQYYNENPEAVGLVNNGAVIEVFVSNVGTWTILATGTDGRSCVLSAGEGWDSPNFVKGQDV